MNRKQLIGQINKKRSFLCIGLDTDITLIPEFLLDREDPVYEFNKGIIDATEDLCVAYKPNSAFYESRGLAGWGSLIKTWKYIPQHCMSIIDAKRSDIGNTSEMYAKAFFDENLSGMSFDAITVSPYMGSDSVKPFLSFDNKWVILLALTSNDGARDFQFLSNNNQPLYQEVIKRANEWAGADRLMFVVGATQADSFKRIRELAPDNFLLVPGIGAQGGKLHDICRFGMNKDCGLLVNASRSIIYSSGGEDFAESARSQALKIQQDMSIELNRLENFRQSGLYF